MLATILISLFSAAALSVTVYVLLDTLFGNEED